MNRLAENCPQTKEVPFEAINRLRSVSQEGSHREIPGIGAFQEKFTVFDVLRIEVGLHDVEPYNGREAGGIHTEDEKAVALFEQLTADRD